MNLTKGQVFGYRVKGEYFGCQNVPATGAVEVDYVVGWFPDGKPHCDSKILLNGKEVSFETEKELWEVCMDDIYIR